MKFNNKCGVVHLEWVSSVGQISDITASRYRYVIIPLCLALTKSHLNNMALVFCPQYTEEYQQTGVCSNRIYITALSA